jgi:hypothetical protein
MGKRPICTSNTHWVDVRTLSPELRRAVRGELQAIVADPEYRMTYLEASRFYNVPYESIKTYVHQGRLQVEGPPRNRRIAHREMRRFLLTYCPKVNGRTLPLLKVA